MKNTQPKVPVKAVKNVTRKTAHLVLAKTVRETQFNNPDKRD